MAKRRVKEEAAGEVFYKKDGDQWMCHRPNFVDLQGSVSGFGETQPLAYLQLVYQEAEAKERAKRK